MNRQVMNAVKREWKAWLNEKSMTSEMNQVFVDENVISIGFRKKDVLHTILIGNTRGFLCVQPRW